MYFLLNVAQGWCFGMTFVRLRKCRLCTHYRTSGTGLPPSWASAGAPLCWPTKHFCFFLPVIAKNTCVVLCSEILNQVPSISETQLHCCVRPLKRKSTAVFLLYHLSAERSPDQNRISHLVWHPLKYFRSVSSSLDL